MENNEVTIESLTKENEELKQRIADLEQTNFALQATIVRTAMIQCGVVQNDSNR